MPPIDIPLSPSLQEAFDLDACDVLRIPLPKPLSVQLPSGGSLKAFTDLSQGIPNDCSMQFNLILQMAPLMASLECPMRMLKLLKPLVDVATGPFQSPPKIPTPALVAEVLQAAADLVPCFLSVTPPALLPFIKDLLCLIRAMISCLLDQLRTVRDLLHGLSLQLTAAEGNDDLMAVVQCAQENAQTSMQNLTQAIDPISVFLELIGPIMGMAGQEPITISVPGTSPTDAESLDPIIETLQGVIDAIDAVTGGICV